MKTFWKQITVAVVLGFLIGAVFGTWHARIHSWTKFGGWGKGHGAYKERMLAQLNKELSLTASQKEQVEAIFETNHAEMMALRDEVRPRFQAIRQNVHGDILQVLTPEQQKRFEQLEAKREAKRRDRLSRWGAESPKTVQPK